MQNDASLLADARRQRFLEELADHTDDSGNVTRLGDATTYTNEFNAYAMHRRKIEVLILVIIAFTTFLLQYANVKMASTGIDTIDVWWQVFIVIPGFVLLIPMVPTIFLTYLPAVDSFVTDNRALVVPLAVSIFWTIACYAFFSYRRHHTA